MLGAMGTKVNQKRRGLCSHEASGLGEETHSVKSHSFKKLQTVCKHSGEEQQSPKRAQHNWESKNQSHWLLLLRPVAHNAHRNVANRSSEDSNTATKWVTCLPSEGPLLSWQRHPQSWSHLLNNGYPVSRLPHCLLVPSPELAVTSGIPPYTYPV